MIKPTSSPGSRTMIVLAQSKTLELTGCHSLLSSGPVDEITYVYLDTYKHNHSQSGLQINYDE